MGGRDYVPCVDQSTAANVDTLLRVFLEDGHLPWVLACVNKPKITIEKTIIIMTIHHYINYNIFISLNH